MNSSVTCKMFIKDIYNNTCKCLQHKRIQKPNPKK